MNISLKNISHAINVYALIFVLMCGNAVMAGFDLFLVLFAAYSFTLFLDGVTKNSISCWLFLLLFGYLLYLIFLKSILLEVPYFDYYYLWPLKAFLCFFVIYNSNKIRYSELESSLVPVLILSSLAFLFIVNFFGYKVDGRLSFVFGPNMLYRFVIAAILIPLVFIVILDHFKSSDFLLVFLLVAFGMFTLYRIGSKGGVVVFLSVFFILALLKYGARWILTSLAISAVAIFSYQYLNLDNLRFVNFSGVENSIRYLFFADFLDSVDEIPVYGYSWSDFYKHSTPGFQYPHNFLIELVYYYGISGIAVCFLVFAGMCRCWSFMKTCYQRRVISYQVVLLCLFLIMSVSSLFSGDLSDNFLVISLAMHGVLSWKFS